MLIFQNEVSLLISSFTHYNTIRSKKRIFLMKIEHLLIHGKVPSRGICTLPLRPGPQFGQHFRWGLEVVARIYFAYIFVSDSGNLKVAWSVVLDSIYSAVDIFQVCFVSFSYFFNCVWYFTSFAFLLLQENSCSERPLFFVFNFFGGWIFTCLGSLITLSQQNVSACPVRSF